MSRISRRAVAAVIAILAMAPAGARATDAVSEIRVDWATYNPVSLILKQKGMLEKEFAKDGIRIVWVQSAGSNKALEYLNAGSIDFGSTAGSAALVARINGNPIKSIYVFSRPEWTALVTTKDSKIGTVADLKGKRVAVTRGTDPHIFLVRAQASTSPRISAVLPSACCNSTGVMSFSVKPASSNARTRKMCGSVPRVTATRLPLRSATVAILESLAVTSAVHSGREKT